MPATNAQSVPQADKKLKLSPFLRWVVDHQSKDPTSVASLTYALKQNPHEFEEWVMRRVVDWVDEAIDEGMKPEYCKIDDKIVENISNALRTTFVEK